MGGLAEGSSTLAARGPLCPNKRTSCGTGRGFVRHPLASVGGLVLGLRCSWCLGSAPGCILRRPEPSESNRSDSSMAKPKSPTPESIADGLTARERVILFCAATDIDHEAVGILASAMLFMEIRGLITRYHGTWRYVLTDDGQAVFRVLPKRANLST